MMVSSQYEIEQHPHKCCKSTFSSLNKDNVTSELIAGECTIEVLNIKLNYGHMYTLEITVKCRCRP